MHKSLDNLNLVKNKVNEIISKKQLKTEPKIIVVSKTFSADKIIPLIDFGHIHFGENKIQEAETKWNNLKKISSDKWMYWNQKKRLFKNTSFN